MNEILLKNLYNITKEEIEKFLLTFFNSKIVYNFEDKEIIKNIFYKNIQILNNILSDNYKTVVDFILDILHLSDVEKNLLLTIYLEKEDEELRKILLDLVHKNEQYYDDYLFLNNLIFKKYMFILLYLNREEINYEKIKIYNSFKYSKIYLSEARSEEIKEYVKKLLDVVEVVDFNLQANFQDKTYKGNILEELSNINSTKDLILQIENNKSSIYFSKVKNLNYLTGKFFNIKIPKSVDEYEVYKEYFNSNISKFKFDKIYQDIKVEELVKNLSLESKIKLFTFLFDINFSYKDISYINEIINYILDSNNEVKLFGFINYTTISKIKEAILDRKIDYIESSLLIDGLIDRYIIEEKSRIKFLQKEKEEKLNGLKNLIIHEIAKLFNDESLKNEILYLFNGIKDIKTLLILYLLNLANYKYIKVENTIYTTNSAFDKSSFLFDIYDKIVYKDKLDKDIFASTKKLVILDKKDKLRTKSKDENNNDKFIEYLNKVNPVKVKTKILEDLL